ncbi:MAG: hypothetical protein JXA21_30000 [Anaerolineae bacterium]|nr:hypothetical protein [Anaerolineae bacterium]
MWLIAEYQPVGLFSLKSALATSSGGKSLLMFTPFALKMGLLDAAYRVYGKARVSDLWPLLRDLPVALDFSEQIVVTNLFTKILKPRRGEAPAGAADAGPLQKTIAFREYVWPVGAWRIALGVSTAQQGDMLIRLLLQINYLGKRGSFVQIVGLPQTAAELPASCVWLNAPEGQPVFSSQGVMQVLDDCGPQMSLDHADIYSGKTIRTGKERRLHHVVLPYRQVRASKSYTLYERF